MLLSELDLTPPIQVVRDGRFRALGLIDHPGEDLLVPCYEPRYLDRLQRPDISCVITLDRLAGRVPSRLGVVIAADPKTTLYEIHEYLVRQTGFYGASEPTRIAETAVVHPRAYVAPTDVRIGAGTIIEPNATILGRAQIGAEAVVRAGSVIGAEGFGARMSGERQVQVPHTGSVLIADHVQVLSNCTIVRSTFGGATTIDQDTIINAQSYVAHNVRIGKRCRIAAGVVIAGSVEIGDDVWIGPHAAISNGLRIGAGASVSLGAVVVRDVAPGERVSGHFAMAHRKFLRWLAEARVDVGG